MGQGAKRLDDMRRNPRGDWQIADVRVVCDEFSIELRPPSSGSHHKVSHPRLSEILTIPAQRPIKPVYIRRLVAFVDAVKEASHDR
jgi:hypothetical protein